MTLFFPAPAAPDTTTDLRGRTIVVLHAHPDDEAIFTGITIRRLADAGVRVVLVTATAGELGEVLVPLRPDETVAQRRIAELERAAELLGVERLVLLDHRDSGLAQGPDGADPGALSRADVPVAARLLADLAVDERAEAVVHYDPRGIYGHPDHVAVHRIGALAAELAGVPAYESTVDREHLHFAGPDAHLIHAASRATAAAFGHVTAEIGLAVGGTPHELAVKRAAIAAHASQVRPDAVAHPAFDDAYQMEWYLRTGPAGVLDRLGNVHAVG
ncbi:MAG: GlcNAc-PI de-N-acetylase [Streptosporangiales bacterium]|nr:GlcNAc-PI de-N-acetylase [Streptosporangiales bacterium]